MNNNKESIQSIREKAKHALESGKITRQEYEYYLQKTLPQKSSSYRAHLAISGMLLVLFAFMAFAVLTGTPTGYSVFDPIISNYTDAVNITINATNISKFMLSGELTHGTVTANLYVDEEKYLVYEYTIPSTTIWTEYSSYAREKNITVEVYAENYTLWLVDISENTTQINNTFVIDTAGVYMVNALITKNETVTKESIVFTVRQDKSEAQNIIREQELFTFTDVCVETCAFATGNASLMLELLTTGNLTITGVRVQEQETNIAPVQIAQVPTIVVNGSVTVDLGSYFSDGNNDTLVYDINNIVGIEETIEGSLLTLSGTVAGEYATTLYVSDLQELLQVPVNILVVEQVTELVEENVTVENVTQEIVNITNITTTTQNSTLPKENNKKNTSDIILGEVIDCTHPNINKRPPECFGDAFDSVFADITSIIKDKEQQKVGRVTRLGNLVLKGFVFENSVATPDTQDFVLGYTQTNNFVDTFTPTAWIDSDTGDLHLAGTLYQEQLSIAPTKYDSYFIMNKNDIVLLYINTLTGDMYVKGNVVQGGTP